MIVTFGYLFITALCVWVVYEGVKLLMERRDALTLAVMLPLSFLWLDNVSIAGGQYLGEGPFLVGVTYLRYFIHWVILPILMVAAGLLLRQAGFKVAQSRWFIGLFWLSAVGFVALDMPYLFTAEFYPACYAETLRLTTSVPDWQLCDPANPPPEGVNPPPIAPIVINLTMMAVGVALWVRFGFKWLTLCSLFMFVVAGLQQAPGFFWGPLLGNLGEPIFNAGILLAVRRFGPGGQAEKDPLAST